MNTIRRPNTATANVMPITGAIDVSNPKIVLPVLSPPPAGSINGSMTVALPSATTDQIDWFIAVVLASERALSKKSYSGEIGR